MDKMGLERGMCLRDEAKKKVKDRRQDGTAHARVEACKNKTGSDKAHCLRSQIMIRKEQKLENKMDRRLEKTSRRIMKIEKKMEHRMMKSSRSSSSSSSSASSQSSSSVSSGS
jgi:hypothetical protein